MFSRVWVSEPATFTFFCAMRYPYQAEPDLQITPIEKIRLPLRSRDELPPILAGLQWLWMHPTLRAEILALLEAAVLAGKAATGRTGMDLWQILVLGVVRLGLDADWDRLEHIANYDSLVRQMLGVPATPWGEETKVFGHQTLRDNVALLDEELLHQINARIAAAGREVFAKKDGAPLAALEVKVDTYVLETDVHFPTDLNLLWDAGRKCVDLIEKYRRQFGYALPGWRKAKAWRGQLKSCERIASQIVYRGGPNKEARVKRAVRDYLAVGRELSAKVHASLLDLCDQPVDTAHWEALEYFHRMLDQHLDLVQRRLLNEETIPVHEKVFSLFEPHTEWIQKGKQRPNVELGHRLLIATDQHQLIQDYDSPVGEAEVDQSIPVADRLLGRYGVGSLASLSFDKGFTRREDWELLSLYVPLVVMPKRGKKNAAEVERESEPKFVALRHQHSAVESEINSLEHHGLNRCPDVGLPGYLRYVGFGVMSYNLHLIGRELLGRKRARTQPARWAA
jgi:transposase, IS5 family